MGDQSESLEELALFFFVDFFRRFYFDRDGELPLCFYFYIDFYFSISGWGTSSSLIYPSSSISFSLFFCLSSLGIAIDLVAGGLAVGIFRSFFSFSFYFWLSLSFSLSLDLSSSFLFFFRLSDLDLELLDDLSLSLSLSFPFDLDFSLSDF